MPCGVYIHCSSVSSDYVGLCLGDYNILYAFIDYGYGNIQLQNTGIQCDSAIPPGSTVSLDSLSAASLISSLDVLSYIALSACTLFAFLFGYSGGRK